MAASFSRTANPSGVSASGNVATYSSVSIGAEAADRMVILLVTTELASASPDSATIDYGSGAVAMTAMAATGNYGSVYARVFYAEAPTGLTATFAVTFGANPSSTQNHISVYRAIGAEPAHTLEGTDGSPQMNGIDPLTTGSLTIPIGGFFIGVVSGADDRNVGLHTWTNATEDLDTAAGVHCHSTATRTAVTTTISCTGFRGGHGALAWVVFPVSETLVLTADAGAFSMTGFDAGLNVSFKGIAAEAGAFTMSGTSASLYHGWELAPDAGTYTITGEAVSLTIASSIEILVAGTGAYSVTGASVSLLKGSKLSVDAGEYLITGQAGSLGFVSDPYGTLWSGVNTGWMNDAEVNGYVPTPGLAPGLFTTAVFPVLLGARAGQTTDFSSIRPERRDPLVQEKRNSIRAMSAVPVMVAAAENRAIKSSRTRRGGA